MFEIKRTNTFKKDFKKRKADIDIQDFKEVLNHLVNNEQLPKNYIDHPLKGYKKKEKMRECHLEPDLLLIYQKKDDYIMLERIGSHNELFKKKNKKK